MSESDVSKAEPQRPAEGGSLRSLLFWFVLTLLGSFLLAWLLGKASARIKLLGLFPIAVGVLTAGLSLELLKQWGLELRKPQIAWIGLLAILVSAGASYQSFGR